MKNKIISIFGPNIKEGGGKALFFNFIQYFVEKHPNKKIKVFCNKEILNELLILKVDAEYIEINNFFTHIFYLFKKIDNCLYFGNLPPLRKAKNTYLFFHNIYLTNDSSSKYNLKRRAQFFIIKIYNKFFLRNINKIFCQSDLVKKKFIKTYNITNVEIMPFYKNFPESKNNNKIYDFCYIAFAEPHKNHILILEALKILALKNIFPSIVLTVEKNKVDNYREKFRNNLINQIEFYKKKYSLNILNLGKVEIDTVETIYKQSKCIIFPSKKETFGLPLLEAQKIDIDILPINLPYVKEVINPEVTFKDNKEDCAFKMNYYIKNYYENNKNFVVLQTNKIDEILHHLLN
ncbi:MAG: hypothetical protein CMD13_01965 [Flavobacteriales bacterium]|nr:hypothetical protein [Flavobacteriales bacterium]